MRLALFNWSNRLAGGAETYLANLIPELVRRRVELALFHEIDAPADRARLPLPPTACSWIGAQPGLGRALEGLRRWRPDLIYAHGCEDPAVEGAVFQIAPTVAFLHNYYGTCISGAKAFKFPDTRPCARAFGAACLGQFYPRRCGGLNPMMAWRLFRKQSQRLDNLRTCRLLLTHSEHMRAEFLRHGFDPSRAVALRFCVASPTAPVDRPRRSEAASRLLFLGRMDHLKGGQVLIEALPEVSRRLGRGLVLTLAGDGPMRSRWEQAATAVSLGASPAQVRFVGWVDAAGRERLFLENDLLVMPSLWPEPFGQVGLEAGFFGVPSVAFDVGGVRAWLEPGVNGMLAPGDPPTKAGLAAAIVGCLDEPQKHQRLAQGARECSARFGIDRHVDELLPLLATAVK